jgi:hypothetical protein
MSAAMIAARSGHHSNSNTIRELNPLLMSSMPFRVFQM